MIVELGLLCTIVGLLLACLLAIAGLAGAGLQQPRLMNACGSLVVGQFVFCALAFAVLVHAFATDDFSVAYVARNSNTLLPWYFKVSAVWGAHEGSFLLWILVTTVWTLAVALTGAHLSLSYRARVLGVMGLLNVGFLSFLIFTSNPFERLLPLTPTQGSDLNPLLQDIGLIIHPPMLYIGYVGFSVAFAFAVAALLSGRLDTAWARWSRPWTNTAWAFLTVGIALGSWWAYYELGWGGWWFWDPVENASFMPWLMGTALVHSLAVTEKRGTFKSWTVLLALSTFTLSLLGAFIVRSGVLTSVHAFAVDPERGLFILAFLALVVGGSLVLYALRASVISSAATYAWLSREAFVLLNNVLLVCAVGLVLVGTLFPLAYEAVTGGDKISVGVPYFNFGFVPLMGLLAVALGFAPMLRWKRTSFSLLAQRVLWLGAISVGLGVILPLLWLGAVDIRVMLTVALGLWIILSHVVDLARRLRNTRGVPPGGYLGMLVAHMGFAVTLIGVGMASQLTVERDLPMQPGEKLVVSGYQFQFVGVTEERGPNYIAQRGKVLVQPAPTGEVVQGASTSEEFTLLPEKRRYLAGGNIMTEAAIDAGLLRDVFVSLGEPLEGGAWALRIQVKPFVRWLWLGALLMAAGGVLAVTDARYRRRRVVAKPNDAASGEVARGDAQAVGGSSQV